MNLISDFSNNPLSITNLMAIEEQCFKTSCEGIDIKNMKREDLILIIDALKFYHSTSSDLKTIKNICVNLERNLCQATVR